MKKHTVIARFYNVLIRKNWKSIDPIRNTIKQIGGILMNRQILKHIGNVCREHRKVLGITQKEVEKETGYTKESISAFENGRNNNLLIFLWYIQNGLNLLDIMREV